MDNIPERPVVPATPEDEMEKIRRKQEIETLWWADVPQMVYDHDIEYAIEKGFAEYVPSSGMGYEIVETIDPKFRVLEKNTAAFLYELAQKWKEQIGQKGIDVVDGKGGYFLRVTSLARTIERQQKLIEDGYPAVENSTHIKLGAFDIGTKWLKQNKPEALAVLDEILAPYIENRQINFIEEDNIGAYHIAYNPHATVAH